MWRGAVFNLRLSLGLRFHGDLPHTRPAALPDASIARHSPPALSGLLLVQIQGPASLCRHTPLPAAEGLRTCSPGTPQPGGPGTSGPVEGQAPGDGAPARAMRGPRGWRDGQSSAASRAPPASPAPGAPRGARGPCASRAACVTRAPCVPHGPRAVFCVSHVMCVSRVLWVSRVCRMLHVHHMLCVLCVLRVPCPVSCGPCVSHAL